MRLENFGGKRKKQNKRRRKQRREKWMRSALSLLGLAGRTNSTSIRTAAAVAVRATRHREMSTGGPVHTAIVNAVRGALDPAELELVDDSASHAGHSGMKGREAVEVCTLDVPTPPFLCVHPPDGTLNMALFLRSSPVALQVARGLAQIRGHAPCETASVSLCALLFRAIGWIAKVVLCRCLTHGGPQAGVWAAGEGVQGRPACAQHHSQDTS